MAKRTETVGTGITAREMTWSSGEDLIPALVGSLRGWSDAFKRGGGAFGAVTLEMKNEVDEILSAAGDEPFAEDSPEGIARKLRKYHSVVTSSISSNDADSAARFAFNLGYLYAQAVMKQNWEAHALRGQKNAAALIAERDRANLDRKREADTRYAAWQALADTIWARRPNLTSSDVAREIAKTVDGVKADTIRKKIRHP